MKESAAIKYSYERVRQLLKIGFETVYQMLDLACDKIVEKYKK